MSIIGNCPHCKASISEVKAVSASIKNSQSSFKGVAYVCPKCNAIFNVELDPLLMIEEIVNKINKR